MRAKSRRQAGFTILETLVVAGIAGAILLAAAPNMVNALSAAQLQSITRSTAQYVRLARAIAVGKNVPSRITVGGGGSTLTTEIFRSGAWTSTGTPLVLGDNAVVSAVSPSAAALAFTAQGTTAGTVTITLRDAAGDTRSLLVSILGAVDPA